MKRLALLLLTLFAGVLCLLPAASALAVDVLDPVCSKPTGGTGGTPTVCAENQAKAKDNPLFGPSGVLTTVMKWIARIVGIVAVIVIAISGVTLAMSGGESNEAATARRALGFAAAGLVVALFAQAIVSFVLTKLK
jgi:hypothetical protein